MPDKTIFSRAFAAYAQSQLGQSVHAALISEQLGKEVIEHVATDGTAIEARERAQPESKAPVTEPARKGQVVPPPEPTRLQRHLEHSLEDNLKDMPPVRCDWGCKTNSQGTHRLLARLQTAPHHRRRRRRRRHPP